MNKKQLLAAYDAHLREDGDVCSGVALTIWIVTTDRKVARTTREQSSGL